MLEAMPIAQQKRIANNVAKVIKTGNINLLTKQAYNYLYLCGGFIAHYNHQGFMDEYGNTQKLLSHIDRYRSNINTNYRQGENDYEYYKSKADCYALILKTIGI